MTTIGAELFYRVPQLQHTSDEEVTSLMWPKFDSENAQTRLVKYSPDTASVVRFERSPIHEQPVARTKEFLASININRPDMNEPLLAGFALHFEFNSAAAPFGFPQVERKSFRYAKPRLQQDREYFGR